MNFPVVTWQVTAPSFEVSDGNTSIPYTPTVNPVWGFGITNAAPPYATQAAADTIGDTVASGVAASGYGSALVEYTVTDTVTPDLSVLTLKVTATLGAFDLVFSSLEDANFYGFDSTYIIVANGQTVTGTKNVAGVWAPSGVSGDVTRTLKQRAAASSSEMSGQVTDVVNWGEVADIEVKSTLFPAANAFKWYASQAIYAAKANRVPSDTNNILENLLEAAAAGASFRIYEGYANTAGYTNDNYLEAKMPGVVQKSQATDVISADDEPRLWSLAGLFFRGNT